MSKTTPVRWWREDVAPVSYEVLAYQQALLDLYAPGIRAVTESGLEIRIHMRYDFPLHVGTVCL